MNPTLLMLIALKTGAMAGWLCGLPLGWACVIFFSTDAWFLYQIFAPKSSAILKTFTRFETTRNEVWLTIDDGPDPLDTPRILELLDRHEAKATFFVIGERAARHPKLIADITQRGHEIAHHTHTHPVGSFWCASRQRVQRELDQTLEVLAAHRIRPRYFRCPVGIKNLFLRHELSLRGLHCIGWNVRSCDSFARAPDAVVQRVLRNVHPGAILLVHEGPPVRPNVRVQAIAGILEGLQKRGLRCVLPDVAQLR
ncbi:MAG: polysaccharide deacetylase family protein [Rariglobus sp.]